MAEGKDLEGRALEVFPHSDTPKAPEAPLDFFLKSGYTNEYTKAIEERGEGKSRYAGLQQRAGQGESRRRRTY